MNTQPQNAPTATGAGAWTAAYSLALLSAANLLSFADRSLLGIVVDPVRKDLALSDTQISIVSGLAFVAFNLLMGLFISRLVDRGNRVRLLAGGVALWSAATWGTAYANGFASLAFWRILVGVGEATAFPVALSLLADLYAPVRLPRSVAIFQSSSGIGVVVGSILAGVLAASFGWRNMFAMCGAAGLFLVLLVAFTMREPARGQQDDRPAQVGPPGGLLASIGELVRQPGFVLLAFGYGTSGMVLGVLPTWAPTFLLRSHHVDLARVGAVIGPAVGLGGIAGAVLSGMLASRLTRRRGNRRAGLLVPIIALPLAAPAFATFLFAPSLVVALCGVAVTNFVMASTLGPCVAIGVSMSRASLRGLASTLMLIAQGLLAGAAAPLVVGVVSDALAGARGADSLRYGLATMLAAPLVATVLLLLAYRRLPNN